MNIFYRGIILYAYLHLICPKKDATICNFFAKNDKN